MSTLPPAPDLAERIKLLREVVELLMWELSAISGRQWESMPELKARKSALAERLKEFDWTPKPEDEESLDLLMLKAQIADLERQSQRKVSIRLDMIRGQIDALRDHQQSWLKCLNGYFKKSPEYVSSL